MSCLEGPRDAAPDFLTGAERVFNDAKTMRPRAPGAIPADARNGARVKAQDVRPEGLYRPNDNFLTPNMRSPDYVQMSTAAAITLGVMSGYMHRTGCTRCPSDPIRYGPCRLPPLPRTRNSREIIRVLPWPRSSDG